MSDLSAPPKVHDAGPSGAANVHAVFYEGLPWRDRPTRVFAYYGIPETASGGKLPGMVLVHGGGGSAFIPWVQLWMSRGYAAIAMDTCGCVSSGNYSNHPRHPDGGPPGWGGFDQVDERPDQQWSHHAVADVILGHSLLRSLPGVDSARIGLTGISWGGYLTCIAAGIDSRFRFAAPVYGCGFLGDNSVWLDTFQKMGPSRARQWLDLWDPSMYLPRARMPMLWASGTNDFAYPMDSWQKSYRLPPAGRTLCLRIRMPHGHGGPGENPPEIHALAESMFRSGILLPRVIESARAGRMLHISFASESRIAVAELNFTTDLGPWQKREWIMEPAGLDAGKGIVEAVLPASATVGYINLADDRGCVVSSAHETLKSERLT